MRVSSRKITDNVQHTQINLSRTFYFPGGEYQNKIKDYENPINMEQRIKIEKEIEDNSKIIELIRKLDVSCFLIKKDVSDNEVSFSYVGKQKI